MSLSAVGGDEGVAHPVLADQRERPFGVELAAVVAEHRHAVAQGRNERIEEPSGPRPIGWGPHEIAFVRKEVVRQLESGEVAEQAPVGVQRALRRTRGARGVDEQGGIVGAGVGRGARVARGADEIPEAAGLAVARHDVFQVVEIGSDGLDDVAARSVGDERARAAVGEPEGECVGTEQHRERQRHRPELVDRDVRDRGLDALGQDDSHPIPAPDAEPRECVGEPIAQTLQLREREAPLDPLRILEVEGGAVSDAGVPIADVDTDVVARGNVPPEAFPNLVERAVRRFDEPHVPRASWTICPPSADDKGAIHAVRG